MHELIVENMHIFNKVKPEAGIIFNKVKPEAGIIIIIIIGKTACDLNKSMKT